MARKTRRRGKRVRATRRVRRIGRVRRSRGGSRRYNNEGGGPFPTLDEVLAKARTLGQEAFTEAKTLGSQVSTLGSNTLSRFTRPSAQM